MNEAHLQPPAPSPPALTTPAWAKVIGIIAIVLGVLAALGGLLGAIAAAIFMSDWMIDAIKSMMANAPAGSDPAPMLEAMKAYRGEIIAQSLVELLVAILLLAGGSMLAGRRAAAGPLLLAWAGLKMAFVVWKAILTVEMNEAIMTAMGGGGPSFSPAVSAFMSSAGAIFTLAWGCLLPIFILVWLLRPKIRAEMRAWSSPGALR